MPLMTGRQYAEHRGVVPGAVSNWKKDGLLVLVDNPKGRGLPLIDSEASDANLRAKVDTTTGRPRSEERSLPPPSSSTEDLLKPAPMSEMERARLDNMRQRTMRSALETGQLMGKLVPVDEYAARAETLGRTIRERSQHIIRHNSERLAVETDPRKITAILSDAFDAMFAQVARSIEREAEEEERADVELAAVEAGEVETEEAP